MQKIGNNQPERLSIRAEEREAIIRMLNFISSQLGNRDRFGAYLINIAICHLQEEGDGVLH